MQQGPDYKRLFEERKKTARNKKVQYHGLTRRIAELWPEKPSFTALSQREQSGLWCGYRDAVAHGNAVDTEISAYAKLGQAEFVRQRGSTVDPCSLAVIQWLRKKGYSCLLSQYVLYDSSSAVKTHLDVLAQNSSRQLVLIELKATIHGSHDSYCGKDLTAALRKRAQRWHQAVDKKFVLRGRDSHVSYLSSVQSFIEAYDNIQPGVLQLRRAAVEAAQALLLQDMMTVYSSDAAAALISKVGVTAQAALCRLSLMQLVGGTTLPNNYYVRHMIQLVMMLKMLHLRYGFLVPLAYVVRVGGGTFWCYPVDAQVLSAHQAIYDTFCQMRAK